MPNALALAHVAKSFGSKRAVIDLDLTVPQGAMYGIIGPNGAGKTTTLRMILSILFPDSGTIEVLGEPTALRAKRRIGYLPEERGVYRKMTVSGFLEHMAILKGVARGRTAPIITKWLERLELADVARKKCEELSKGMQQKIQFIAAVIHDPELLVLDEPFSGLDPLSARLLRAQIVEQHARGATVLFSTHVMEHAEQLCDHIVMIHEGRKVLDDPMTVIRERQAPRSMRFEPLAPNTDCVAALRGTEGIAEVTRAEGFFRIDVRDGVDVGSALQAVAARVAPSRIELIRPTLEDVFIEIASVRGDATSAEGGR